MRTWKLAVAAGIAAAFGAGACATSASLAAARRGDLDALARAIRADRAAGRLDREEIDELASARASRELATAEPPEQAARLIRELSPCARHVEPSLRARAGGRDEAAAAATMALLDARAADDAKLARSFADDPDPQWRAVGARACRSKEFGPKRRQRTVDVDERVRIAALRACIDAAAPEDTTAVLEAARLDPNPLARALAVRAAAAIGTEPVVVALEDRLATGDEPLRIAIVDAWSSPAMFDRGGERELARLAERDAGIVGEKAAAALASRRPTRASAAQGWAALARSARDGSARVRALVAEDLPVDPASVPILDGLATDHDAAVRAAALGRLTGYPARRAKALRALHELEAAGNVYARSELAIQGDTAALRAFAADLHASDPGVRRRAGQILLSARDLGDVTDLLADSDPALRADFACGLMLASGSSAPLAPPVSREERSRTR